MSLSASAALWFLIAALPIGIYAAWSDLARMKIPNRATDALILSYAVLGLIALPFGDYLWGYLNGLVVLLIGMALNAARVIGAGDAKFCAAAAPMIAASDAPRVLLLLSACLVAGYVVHRAVKHSPLRDRVPHWESWQSGKRFPMGFPLASALILYLLFCVRAGLTG